jgi:tetratricopeptide (TPR) repeat protein
MELQLSYDPQTRHKTSAAFLRGNSPEQWFREMSDWQIPLKGLTCLLLPEHKSSITPGGLLVIFKDQVPAPGTISHPYSVINGNLFIPVDAVLVPALSSAEMRALLIWHMQVYHPAIGFVGFDAEDELSLSSFIAAGQSLVRSWNHAHPGMPPLAYLQSVAVEMPSSTALADLLNDGQSIHPLSEIPGKKPPASLLMRIVDRVLRGLLLLLLGIINIIAAMRPTVPAKSVSAGKAVSGGTGRPATVKTGGLREKLRKWIEKTMGDIDDRRESELNRLLKMFDKDGDEALKYAIPLAGNHMAGRGTAPQSASLTKKTTNFSLGKLFDNQPVDTWAADDDFNRRLTQKYEQQARKALEQGDYRKAAYIYAHLLGNLYRAATVLEQGQFYHEAAALYMDHLNQPEKAAECFEKGGLLLDAINIYKKLQQYEKTGDLYKQLSQDKAAQHYFRQAINAAMQQKNHLEAARILQHKSHLLEEACDVLLEGWHDGTSAMACLTQYFELTKKMDENGFPDKIRKVYEHETPEHKRNGLVEILLDIRTQMNAAAQQTTTEIVYEIVSPQIAAGDESKLAILRKMLHGDKELPADVYRYSTQQKQLKQGISGIIHQMGQKGKSSI